MCIFHVLTVRGLPGSEGASAPCMGLPGKAEVPLATRLCTHTVHNYGSLLNNHVCVSAVASYSIVQLATKRKLCHFSCYYTWVEIEER